MDKIKILLMMVEDDYCPVARKDVTNCEFLYHKSGWVTKNHCRLLDDVCFNPNGQLLQETDRVKKGAKKIIRELL